jgi:hypothetical protein
MTSQINPNNIDGNYPVAGVDNNSQGFRDNFTNTKTNFQYAQNELNDLQNKVVLKAALIGTTLDNDMADNLIYAAKIRDFSATKVAVSTTSGSITLDYSAGHYQTITTAGSVSLSFSNFPPSGSYGLMRIQIYVTNVAHTMELPAAVSLGLSGIQGIIPGTSGVSNTITFGATGYYEFAFGSSDSGTTITLFDLNRALTNFTSAAITTTSVAASGNITAGGTISAPALASSGTISAAGNVTGGNISAATAISAAGNITGGNVIATSSFSTTGLVRAGNVSATVNPTAGTTTVAPVNFTAGTLLVTPAVGAVELDSSVFYGTPTAGSASSQRGVLPAQHVIVAPSGGRTLAQSTSSQAVFDNPASGALTVTASTTYEIEGYYVITNTASPSTAHSISLLFAVSGSLTSISYIADVTTSSGSPTSGATTVSRNHSTLASALQITPAGTTTNTETVIVHIRGLLRTNASGTIVPQIKYNTNAPGGDSVVTQDSWFRMSAWGNSSLVSVGNWS